MDITTAMVLIITTVTTVSRNAANSRIAYPDKVSVTVSLISSGANGLVVARGRLVVLVTTVVPPLSKRKSVRK